MLPASAAAAEASENFTFRQKNKWIRTSHEPAMLWFGF